MAIVRGVPNFRIFTVIPINTPALIKVLWVFLLFFFSKNNVLLSCQPQCFPSVLPRGTTI